jgi:hypothetical protein
MHAIVLVLTSDKNAAVKWSRHIQDQPVDISPRVVQTGTVDEARQALKKFNEEIVLVVASGSSAGILTLIDQMRAAAYRGPVIVTSSSSSASTQLVEVGCTVCLIQDVPDRITKLLPEGIAARFE